jgi:hypothetical protein
MDFDISGSNFSFYDLVETGYNLISGAGKDVVDFVSEDIPGFISSAYEKVEDVYERAGGSPLLGVGKSIASQYLSSSSQSARPEFRDSGFRKDASARQTQSQGDIRRGGVDPQSVGYVPRVSGMMSGLDKSLVPAISQLYQKLGAAKSQGPNIPIPDESQDIDVQLVEKYK